ncbi:hypothetical protein ACRRTK_010578 [Alexandromys fortis]
MLLAGSTSEAETRGSERASGAHGGRNTHAGGEREENRGRRPPEGTTGTPGDHRHTAAGSEQAAHGGTRTDERERRAGGGRRVAGTGRGHPPGTAEPPRDGRAPARRTAPTDHAAVPSRRPRAGARERVWSRGGPPHTHAAARRNAGESGMIPDPLRAGSGDREPDGRETTHRANGLGGRDGRRPPPGREAEAEGTGTPRKNRGPLRVLANAGERQERGERDDDDTRTVFPSRDVRGDAAAHDARTGPDLGDGESHRPEPPPPAAPEEKKSTQAGGISPPGTQPGRRRRRGRKSPQTHLSRRTHRHAADDGRPLSLLPSRGSRNTRSLASRTLFSHGPTAETDAPAAAGGRPPAATGPDASGDAPGDSRPPFSPKAAPEREVTTPQSQNRIPDHEEGRVNRFSPTVGTLPGRGERGDLHTAHNTSDARTRRARRGRGPRERQRRGSAGGTARGGARTVDGWGPGAHRHPAPFFPLGSASRPRLRRAHGTPSSRHALLPRVVPPRTRSEEARAALGDTENARVSPPKDGTWRGAPGRSYAHREVRACQGGDPKHALSSDR